MTDDPRIEREEMRELVDDIVARVVCRYRISPADAAPIVRAELTKDRELRQIALSGRSVKQLARMGAYKRAVTNARRRVYYHLRRYKAQVGDGERTFESLTEQLRNSTDTDTSRTIALEIAAMHVSTRERVDWLEQFNHQLLSAIGGCRTILDVGCGVYPLTFPFDDPRVELENYVAVDKDPVVVEAVSAFVHATRNDGLITVRWDIRDGWESLLAKSGRERFDVGFLFKLIPVLNRRDRPMLEVLAHTPGDCLVVTGSKVSMTRGKSVERRERAVIGRFCQTSHRQVAGEFSTDNEFALVLKRIED